MAQTFVVTGAGRGIGLELARQLSERGEDVVATARNLERAADLRALGVELLPLDVADSGSVQSFARELGDRAVDVLINNAGVYPESKGPRSRGLAELEEESMREAFEVNSLGPLRVTRALLGNLRAGRGRHPVIAQITSKMGSISDNTSGGSYAYRASKAALNMITKSLALDLQGEGIRCVVLHPGWVQTSMGGGGAPLSVGDSVRGLLGVIDGLRPEDSGGFFDFSGERLPW